MMIAPRALSDLAGMGGPLLTWLPMFAHRGEVPLSKVLVRTMIWYLAVIGTTRHLHWLTGWDPSGHAVVYGAQLAPLCQLWEESHGDRLPTVLHTLSRVYLLVWGSVLCYLSATTAMAFHTLSETAASLILVLLLSCWLSERDMGRRRAVERWQVVVAFVAWLVPTVWSWTVDNATPFLQGMLVYDLSVWLCFFLALGEAQAEPL